MRQRCVVTALMMCGLALSAGCPIDPGELGLDFGFDYEIIPDGVYQGNATAIAELWHDGERIAQTSGETAGYAKFVDGELLAGDGSIIRIGDVEEVDIGGVWITREVFDIYVNDWYYEVSYDVWTEWNSVPMEGTEYLSFGLNSDDSITMFDTLELVSLDEFDGGASVFHLNGTGKLIPGEGPAIPPRDLLDLKSGKPRQ